MSTVSIATRFWSKVAPANENGCRLWTAAQNGHGYGAFNASGLSSSHQAHRIAWELAHGPIPRGLFILHRCDVRACCEPSHLFLGTQAENLADAKAKRRHAHGARMGSAKLSEDQAASVRTLREAGYSQAEVGKMFGVARSTIQHIDRGRTWLHLQRG